MKWDVIETFFLDMDGTLLDLAYDNYFWHEHIPNLYSKKEKTAFAEAKIILEGMYMEKKGTIEWYSINYWSDILNINLKSEILNTKDKISVLPNTIEFLKTIKKNQINTVLITNCPREMLNIKITQTKLWGYFNKIISSHDYGYAKETENFWTILNKNIIYNREKTFFIDDNENVLKFAEKNGIKNLISINYPDSKKEKQTVENYTSINNVSCFSKKFIR
jgi:putative hydrolase of the HAD superfamily